MTVAGNRRAADAVSILIVDDEPTLLSLLSRQLRRCGYSVTTCTTAAEAVDLLTSEPARWSIAIIDVSLPDLSGIDLVRRMLPLIPAMRFVVASGHPVESEGLPFRGTNRVRVLQKPFTPEALLAVIDSLLA